MPDEQRNPWQGDELSFTLTVRPKTGGKGYRAEAAWASDGKVLASGEGPTFADAIAGATASLSSRANREASRQFLVTVFGRVAKRHD
jgi:hypothetical protein